MICNKSTDWWMICVTPNNLSKHASCTIKWHSSDAWYDELEGSRQGGD